MPAPLPSTLFDTATSAPGLKTKVFRGFCSASIERTGGAALYDIALIDRDLLNAFHTRVGERVMRPDYGCKLWLYLFDPLTPLLHDQIVAEVQRICELDSRVAVLDTQVFEYEHGLRIEVTLDYRPFDVVNTFKVEFDQRQSAYFGNSDVAAQ